MTELTEKDMTFVFGIVGIYIAWKRQKSLNNMLDEIRESLPVI